MGVIMVMIMRLNTSGKICVLNVIQFIWYSISNLEAWWFFGSTKHVRSQLYLSFVDSISSVLTSTGRGGYQVADKLKQFICRWPMVVVVS